MVKGTPRFITFHADGVPSNVGPEGDYVLPFKSNLLFRYRLVDDEVVDRFPGMSDEQALDEVERLAKEQAEKVAAVAAEAAAKRPYTIFKTTVISRMDDEELAKFKAGYDQQDDRGKMMWDDCVSLVSTDDYFALLRQLFDAVYGEDRAKELLAPIV